MADDDKQPRGIAAQVMADLAKQKRDGVKARCKTLFEDLLKSDAVTHGIAEKIADELAAVGEMVTVADIRMMM